MEEDSEIASIYAAKLGFYLTALPREIELLSNMLSLSSYPDDEET